MVICKNKSYITFVIDPSLMMAQSWAESTRDTYNYGQYINKFPPNTIKVIWEFERIQKKIYRHKRSIMFNEICINEEMLPIYINTHTHIHTYELLLLLLHQGCRVSIMVIVKENGISNPSSNPGWGCCISFCTNTPPSTHE